MKMQRRLRAAAQQTKQACLRSPCTEIRTRQASRDVTYGSSRRLELLIQTIPLPYKGLSEHEQETIRIARRDYLNDRQ